MLQNQTVKKISWNVSIYLILPASLGHEAHSGYNRNEYLTQKNNNISRE
jgi:hypothetical protein